VELILIDLEPRFADLEGERIVQNLIFLISVLVQNNWKANMGYVLLPSAVHLYSLSAFQRSQTPLPQPKRGIKDKFKELFASKSKSTSQTHSPALPGERIFIRSLPRRDRGMRKESPDSIFEVSQIDRCRR
jgi:hypothetical protein